LVVLGILVIATVLSVIFPEKKDGEDSAKA